MPPPAAFIDITSIPFSRTVTQAEFNGGTFGDNPNEVFFRYVATVPEVLGFQTDSGGTFVPRTTVYESDGSTEVDPARTGSNGMWSPLLAAGTYYIKIIRNGTGSSDFDFTAEFDTFLLDDVTLEPGDRIINDDQDRPGVVIAADGTIKSFVSTVPGGEMGAILPSGVSIWHDRYGRLGTDKLAVLDANLQYIGGANAGLIGTNKPILATDGTQFYVFNQGGALWTVSAAAVEADTGYESPLSLDLPWAMAVDHDGTTLYWLTEDEEGTIHTVNLGSFVDGADFYTIPGFDAGNDKFARTANTHPGELLWLDDGSLVTYWFDASALEFHLIHISASGSLLHDIVFEDPTQIDHIARILGDSTGVLIWLYTTIGLDTGHFGRITFSTELITDDFTKPLFEAGVNMQTGGTVKFGISTSCTMLRFGVGGGSGSPSPSSPGVFEDGEIGPIAWVEEWEDTA